MGPKTRSKNIQSLAFSYTSWFTAFTAAVYSERAGTSGQSLGYGLVKGIGVTTSVTIAVVCNLLLLLRQTPSCRPTHTRAHTHYNLCIMMNFQLCVLKRFVIYE